MLDDRKLSARALFDDNSQRQTQMVVGIQMGHMLCYSLPFHVYVSAAVHTQHHINSHGRFPLIAFLSQRQLQGAGEERIED